jgi:CRISPR-associated endonuclease/helicase Cas3
MSPHPVLEPWGKLDRTHPDFATAPRLSLVAHCIDVAAVLRALLELPTWRRRLERLEGGVLSDLLLDRLTVLAFLHDTGKAGAGFYSKGLTATAREAWLRHTHAPYTQCGHTRVVAPLLGFDAGFAQHREALGVPALRAWGGADEVGQEPLMDLWLAAVSHHGEPISMSSLKDGSPSTGSFPTWTQSIAGYDPLCGLRQLGDAVRTLWPAAFARAAPHWEPRQPFIHAFAGLVSLADWIGSNAQNFFPYDLGPQGVQRWDVALPRARQVLRDMRIDLEAARTDLRRRAPGFRDVFESYEPTDVQLRSADPLLPSPVVLEAETGSGKTEAALWRFKALFEAGEVDALCFLLPTRVAATGIYTRLNDFVCKLFPDEAMRPSTVLAVPAYLRANGEDGQRQLPGFEVTWPDGQSHSPLFWAAENSKRYFAASAAAATVDQFLLSTLQTKHAHLRGGLLLRSLVVVDEVHASDPYMRTLLGNALKRHLAAGGHAMLLSATLTADARDALMRCTPPVPGRRRDSVKASNAQPPAPDNDYPRITAPGHIEAFGPVLKNKQIRHTLRPWMRDPDKVAGLAATALLGGARVLVLRNTVRQAVATQQALESLLGIDHPALFRCRGVVALHHGRYALPDRKALDEAVGLVFGKTAAEIRAPVVLCATQTVEISVDCDADFLITDLAPMDVLLQRLGRTHRHRARDAFRPPGYETAQCVVLTPPDRDLSLLMKRGSARGLGLGEMSAYPDLLCLEATWRALEDCTRFPTLDIPTHNRALVESACGRPALKTLADSLGGAWSAHFNDLLGRAGAQSGQAHYASIDWLKPWRDAVPGELSADARTRLGLDGIELELPEPFDSPFAYRIDRLTLPAWMLPPSQDAGDGVVPAIETWHSCAGTAHFNVRGRSFIYDRHGLAIQAA